jgi:hypothetical protein
MELVLRDDQYKQKKRSQTAIDVCALRCLVPATETVIDTCRQKDALETR